MGQAGLVIASNRGPCRSRSTTTADPVPSGSAGGLAAALYPLVEGSGATWVSCAMSEADRKAAAAGLMDERDAPAGHRAARPRHLPDGLRRGVELDAVELPSPPVRPRPPAGARPPLRRGLRRLPLLQRPVRRRRRRRRRRRGDRARPGLPPVPRSPGSSPLAVPICGSSTSPTPPSPSLACGGCSRCRSAGSCWPGWPGGSACGFHAPRWEAGLPSVLRRRGVEPLHTFVSPLSLAPEHAPGAAPPRLRAWPPPHGSTTSSPAAGWWSAPTGSSPRRTCCAASGPSTSCSDTAATCAAASSWSPTPTRRARACPSTSLTAPRSSRPRRG